MKLSIFIFVLVAGLSLNAFANPLEVEPSNDQVLPSQVQKVITVQAESANTPSVKLVKVTNGGSTDVSSVIAPSRLYLGLHLSGEMFNTEGNYMIHNSIVQLKDASLSKDGKSVVVNVMVRSSDLKKLENQTLVLDISEAVADIKNAKSDFDKDVNIQTMIGEQVRQ